MMSKQSFRALSVLLLLALLSANVNADPVKVGNLYYNFVLKGKLASVTSCPLGECYEGDIVIPPTVEHKGVVCNVTSIENDAFVCVVKPEYGNPQRGANDKLTSVTIPESVTSIGSQAFYQCIKLTSISLPESVSEIGESAFSGCTGLVSAKLPKSLTKIPGGLFSGCKSLTTLDISESITEIGSNAFENCVNLPSIDLKNVEKIETYAFHRCKKLTTITMSDNLKKIGQEAFRECSNLSTIKWSENLREIDTGAFWYCKALESVELPDNVKSIGSLAFGDCINLTTVKIGSNILQMAGAFRNCTELTDVYIYGRVPDASSGAFDNSMIEYSTLHVPAGFISFCRENSPWDEFGEYVALSDEELGLDAEKNKRIITFEDPQVKALCVSNWDYNGDGELSEAEAAMPTSFSNLALWDWDNNGVFDDGEIHNIRAANIISVFKDNTKIKTFDELKYFTGLKYFTETGMNCIEFDAFSGCTNLTKVTLPEGVTIIDSYAFNNCTSLSSVTIPDNVTTIGSGAFNNCSSLATVTIGKNVQRIGDGAFGGCNGLTSIIIPESVTAIGNSAFSSSGLTSVSLPSSLTKIEAETFYQCFNLTTVTIPNSVTEIGNYAFTQSGLTSVTIPQSVTSIGVNAFSYLSSLKEVRSLRKDPFPFEVETGPFGSYEYTTLYVPVGSKAKYKSAEGWSNFNTIIEVGDANGDDEVDKKDVESIASHIIGEAQESFDERAADMNDDKKVNVVDIVEVNNQLAPKD